MPGTARPGQQGGGGATASMLKGGWVAECKAAGVGA